MTRFFRLSVGWFVGLSVKISKKGGLFSLSCSDWSACFSKLLQVNVFVSELINTALNLRSHNRNGLNYEYIPLSLLRKLASFESSSSAFMFA